MVNRIESIPVGIYGRVTRGDCSGFHIMVEDDEKRSGGFLIRTSPPEDDIAKGYRFDGWVESLQDLPQYFREASYQVAWDDGTQTI